jgi:hypothetical protein
MLIQFCRSCMLFFSADLFDEGNKELIRFSWSFVVLEFVQCMWIFLNSTTKEISETST